MYNDENYNQLYLIFITGKLLHKLRGGMTD